MLLRIIRNDIASSRATTLITTIFIAIASMVISLAVILAVTLTGAVDHLMTQAKTPHVMQMHTGTIDTERLRQFVSTQPNVAAYQVTEFLNIDGSQFQLAHKTLAASSQDNGLTPQNEQFDRLLDLNGAVVHPERGQIYAPLSYFKDGSVHQGDQITVAGQRFTVAGFIRDSQMNSTLSSSKRWLVNTDDYRQIRGQTRPEYLIEFRLHDLAGLNAFTAAYSAARLEANGPTLTYPLFQVVNALSDGMIIAMLLMVGIIVVIVALLCVRLTLLAKIEDDYRQIGVMRAIGMRLGDIKIIYLAKYLGIVLIGMLGGYGISLAAANQMMENIRLYMGQSDTAHWAAPLAITGVVLLGIMIIATISRSLNRLKRISPVQAIRDGVAANRTTRGRWMTLQKSSGRFLNGWLGVKAIATRPALHITMLIVFVLAVCIMILPYGLYATVSDKDFVTHMGASASDIRIDIQQGDIPAQTTAITRQLAQDRTVSRYMANTTRVIPIRHDNGNEENLKIEMVDSTTSQHFRPHYSSGTAPQRPHDIALSALLADELHKSVGDHIVLRINNQLLSATVTGIYSDITNGGKTAKAILPDNTADVMWSIIAIRLHHASDLGQTVARYSSAFPRAKVTAIDDYVRQTFGSTIDATRLVAIISAIIAGCLIMLIALLSTRMFIAKERRDIAISQVVGFTIRDIRRQYSVRIVTIMIIAIAIASIISACVGSLLVEAMLSQFGARSVHLTQHPLMTYVCYPALALSITAIGTFIGARSIRHTNSANQLKEE